MSKTTNVFSITEWAVKNPKGAHLITKSGIGIGLGITFTSVWLEFTLKTTFGE